jgi:NodT family efflux transporter outer membrane factor (OMF) lipoprotein
LPQHTSAWRAGACLVALALAACTKVGPDFAAPEAGAPKSFGPGGGAHSIPVAEKVDPDWWKLLGDPELTRLETRLAAGNFDLRAAATRLAEARAQLGISAAAAGPSLNAIGSANNSMISQVGAFHLPSHSTTQPPGSPQGRPAYDSRLFRPHEVFEAGFDASWELDLWGRVARLIESSTAQLAASEDALHAVEVTASAELARDYVLLRGTQLKAQITRENLQIARKSLALTQQRAAGGLTTDLDVANAAATVEIVAAELPALEARAAQLQNAIALLLGEQPRALEVELAAPRPVPPVPPRVPVGVPSELALRRPDIRQALAVLHAATADIGVATADFYPRITLLGSASQLAINLHNLFDARAFTYSIGPSITLPLFDGGRIKRTVELREAQQQEAAIGWERTVLTAFHEVDDALTGYDAEQRRHDRLQAAVAANRRALSIAGQRYEQGVTDFLQVLVAQRNLLAAEQDLADSTTTISTDFVQLYKALGGGWQAAANSD